MLRTALALPALLVLLATSHAGAQPTDAVEVGMIFCKDVLEGTEPIALLTPDLIVLVEHAVDRNAEIEAAVPNEKPPLGDGIPWTSWPDRADHCEVEETAVTQAEARLSITYSFDAWPDATFADTLVLKPSPRGWFIDDILFVDDLTLRGVLAGIFDR